MQLSAAHMNLPAMIQGRTEAQVFFNILLHDDRNSRYIVSTEESGSWQERAFSAAELSVRRFRLSSNCYVSHNGFTSCCRQLERVRQLNALFFDIDCHDAPVEDLPRLIEETVARVTSAAASSRLPMPSLIVDSGRGVHLYFVLSRSVPYRVKAGGEVNKKGDHLFKTVQRQLADVIEEVVAGIRHAVVDRSVFDHTRVSRIPGTWNAKAQRYARLLHASDDYHHLKDLKSFRASCKARSNKVSSGGVVSCSRPLMTARLRKVEELQRHRAYKCDGNRERMAFVYYNTAVQIYRHDEAACLLVAFNEKFSTPLPQREIDNVIASVDRNVNLRGEKGFYILGLDKLTELLALTEEEAVAIGFFSSKRMTDRAEAKRKTKEKRDARNAKIVELYKEGALTQKAVAEALNCSLSTVKTILAAAGLTRCRTRSGDDGCDSVQLSSASAKGTLFAKPKRSIFWQTGHVVRSSMGLFMQSSASCALRKVFETLPLQPFLWLCFGMRAYSGTKPFKTRCSSSCGFPANALANMSDTNVKFIVISTPLREYGVYYRGVTFVSRCF